MTTTEVKATYNNKTKRYHFVLVDNDNDIKSDIGSLMPSSGSPDPNDFTILELDFYEG